MTLHMPMWVFWTVFIPIGLIVLFLCWFGSQIVMLFLDMWDRRTCYGQGKVRRIVGTGEACR